MLVLVAPGFASVWGQSLPPYTPDDVRDYWEPPVGPASNVCYDGGRPQEFGYSGRAEDSRGTNYHRYGVSDTLIHAFDGCVRNPFEVVLASPNCAGMTLEAVNGPVLPVLFQAEKCGPVGGDGEFEYGLGAAWLNVRAGPGYLGGDGLHDCYGGPGACGTNVIDGCMAEANVKGSPHHGAGTTVFVQDALAGGNVGFFLVADWARNASLSASGIDENKAPGMKHCGDGIIEPCKAPGHPGFRRNIADAFSFPFPTSPERVQQDVHHLLGCNPLDKVVYQPPAGVGSRVNVLNPEGSTLVDFGWGGAAGQLIVILAPVDECSPTGSSTPTTGWIWTGHANTSTPPTPPPATLDICPDSSVGMEFDQNEDGYGDEWIQPFKDYAQQLADKLNDPENNLQGDGLTNLNEFRWQTIPIGPFTVGSITIFPNARDYDKDNLTDGQEWAYWNDPNNDHLLGNAPSVAFLDPDYSQDHDLDSLTTTHDPDSDNDGILDGDEALSWKSYPEFVDSDCTLAALACKPPLEQGTTWNARQDPNKPGTGDNITDREELLAWLAIGPTAWRTDYDGDKITSNLLDPDADADGALDGDEFHCHTYNATNNTRDACTRADQYDTDGDGASDGTDETAARTDPRNPDTDGDGLPDGWEYRYHLNPRNASDAHEDPDQDGLSNTQEYSYRCGASPCPVSPVHWSGLDPLNPDADQDALQDGGEVEHAADPFNPDSDYDGLRDGQEVHAHGTSPMAKDTDGDGLTDYQEIVTYRTKGPDPLNPNTDASWNGTNDDILSDYEEIIQYRTNVTNWDSDGDGVADGRDERPLSYDYQPKVVPLRNGTPLATPDEAYVIFRQEGYIDIMLRDAHENEQDVAFVTAHAHLEGTYKTGGTGGADIILDATRGSDGSVWGARMPLPERLASASSESFTLVVVTTDGNTREYVGQASEPLNSVEWKNETDPTSDWATLADHSDAPSVHTGSSLSSPQASDVGSLASGASSLLEGLAIYRLKPFILTPSPDKMLSATNTTENGPLDLDALGLADVPGASAFGLLQTQAWDRAPDGSPLVVNLSEMQISVVQDAFEYVDPILERGVYESMASAPYASPGVPLWRGMPRSWMPDPCWGNPPEWCASYYYGPQDPRAKGNTQGDTVAGIIGYRDYQGMIASYEEGDNVNAGIHLMMLGMAWGPGALAAAGKLGRALKALAATDAAFSSFLLKGQATSVAAGDFSISTTNNYAKWATWGEKNTGQTHNALLLARGTSTVKIRLIADTPDPSVSTAKALRIANAGDDGATIAAIRDFDAPSTMFPEGGIEAVDRMGRIVKQLDDVGEDSAQFVDDAHILRHKGNADGWLRDIEPRVVSEKTTRGIAPSVHETHALAEVERGHVRATVNRATGETAIANLDPPPGSNLQSLDQEVRGVLKDGVTPVKAQVDGVGSVNGKLAVYDPTVSREYGRSGYEFVTDDDLGLLERQVAGVFEQGNGQGHVFVMPKKGASSGFMRGAARIEGDYQGVMIHIIDGTTMREIPWWTMIK